MGLVNVSILLAVQQTQALLIHDQLPVGWGGVGRGKNVKEALRKMNARSTITNLLAVAPFYIYLTRGYRHGIYKQYINRRVIYIYIYISKVQND